MFEKLLYLFGVVIVGFLMMTIFPDTEITTTIVILSTLTILDALRRRNCDEKEIWVFDYII